MNYAYDGAGRVVSEDYSPCLRAQPIYTPPQANGDGTEALFHYDTPEPGQTSDFGLHAVFLMGRLATVADRAQHSRYSYDGRGRKIHTAKQLAGPGTSPAMLSLRYTPTWYHAETVYDEADRPIAQTTGADVTALQGMGVTVGRATSTSLVSVTYDNRDIPVQVGGSYGALVTNETHFGDGLIKSRQYADAGQTTGRWSFNTNRLPTRALLSRASVTPTVLMDTTAMDYDPVGNALTLKDNRKKAEWPAGAEPVSRSATYDDLYRLRSVSYAYPGDDSQTPLFGETDLSPMPLSLPSTRVMQQSYDYDWQDNLVSSTDDANAFFTRSVGTGTYGPSSAGPNQVQSVASRGHSAAVTYDAAGNMTSIAEPQTPTDGDTPPPTFQLQYQWDEVGRLSSAVRSDYEGTALTATTTVLYAYDASGQRVSRSVEVDADETGTPAYFLEIFPSLRVNATIFDSATGDYDRDETTETAYLAVGGASYGRVIVDDSVPKTAPGGISSQHVYLQMTDHLGSTNSTVDLASGILVEQSTYLPYGGGESDYRAPGWDSFRESYRYTGKEDDYQVGLIYFGQRYFSPALGRWASADPLAIHGLSGDPNPYSFCHGSPLRFVDPLGLTTEDGQPITITFPGTDASPTYNVVDNGTTVSAEQWAQFQAVLGSYANIPDSDISAPLSISQVLNGSYGDALVQSQLQIQGEGGVWTSAQAPLFEQYYNPNATNFTQAQILGTQLGNPSLQQYQAGYFAASMVPVLGEALVLANPNSTPFARVAAVAGIALGALGAVSSFAAAAEDGVAAVRPLVYGPSAGGRLAATAEQLGGDTLTSLQKPSELGWEAFSKQTLDAAAASGRPVVFDLTHVEDLPGVLSGTGQYANTVTGAELRYIQANWAQFQGNVTFIGGRLPW